MISGVCSSLAVVSLACRFPLSAAYVLADFVAVRAVGSENNPFAVFLFAPCHELMFTARAVFALIE
jgi:hypothetical protein